MLSIVLYYTFAEINLYNLVSRPKKSVLSILFLKIMSGVKLLHMTVEHYTNLNIEKCFHFIDVPHTIACGV